jgi:REP element-mobilizing transposase RayT
VSVGGFSVMNNHLHLLLRLDPEVARAWSDSG